jgi:hypothetical protein
MALVSPSSLTSKRSRTQPVIFSPLQTERFSLAGWGGTTPAADARPGSTDFRRRVL